jgi:type III pantothenate kinase
MKAAVAVDVGNTRIKWGRILNGAVQDVAALDPVDAAAWQRQARAWEIPPRATWTAVSVNPDHCSRLMTWLESQGHVPWLIESYQQLPLALDPLITNPERIGLDRLVTAVAANHRAGPRTSRVLVSAGTAVVVDLVDGAGMFRGGAILPGLGLMARSLNEHTAKLPLVDVVRTNPSMPGLSTESAIGAGVWSAVAWGINRLIDEVRAAGTSASEPIVYLTGGDAPTLAPFLKPGSILWPEMTLEGLRLVTEALP